MVNAERLTSKRQPPDSNDRAARGAIREEATRDVPNHWSFLCKRSQITNQPPTKKNMNHTKTFSTEAHMLQFFKDFKDEFMCCHEVGKAGEYVLKFTLKI